MKNIVQTAGNVKPVLSNREIEGLTKRKKGSAILAFAYEKTGLADRGKKALKLRLCGKKIVYAEDPDGGGPVELSAMRCELRLCPSCSWIRARRVFQNVYSIITEPEFSGKRFAFLTLTVRNCRGEALDGEIKRLLAAWNKLTKTSRSPFRKSFIGTFRALEVTYNPKDKTYHPHLHAIAAVEPGYFRKSNRDYISQPHLRELWRGACGLGYLPQCRIERVRNSAGKQVAEVAKYTVKSADYISRPEVVEVLDRALHRKRLVAYGGLFKAVRARLGLPDEELPDGIPRQTVAELMRNPCVRKIVLEWKMGAYCVSPMA